jgi:fructose-bisphosphate aldolase class II
MQSLREYILEAQKIKKPIWHFNAGSYEHLKAYYLVAEKFKEPIIIGLSEGERKYLDIELVCDTAHRARKKGIPLFVNADHTHSLEKIQEAVIAGCDAVLFDAGKENLETNIKKTKEVVSWVRSYNKEHSTDVLIEGEMGYIGSGSIVRSALPEGLSELTEPHDALRFVKETEVDLLAPAVGTIHGIVAQQPLLDISRIAHIHTQTGVPLVLHGGSGVPLSEVSRAVAQGISIIHIATELRVAWRKGLEDSLKANMSSIAPYEVLSPVVALLYETVVEKIEEYKNVK